MPNRPIPGNIPRLWFAIFPAIPFILATFAMGLVFDARIPPLFTSIPLQEDLGFGHLGDRLTYAAAAFLQFMACLVVIILHCRGISKSHPSIRRNSSYIVGTFLVVSFIATALIRLLEAAPYQLTFDLPRQIMLASHGPAAEFAREGFLLGQSRTFWAAIIPLLMGVATVATASGYAATLVAPPDLKSSDWESSHARRSKRLQSSFRSSSFVLVTSATALLLFLKIPGHLITEAGSESFDRFALGLTMLWGTVMTFTLVAVYVPPFLAIRQEAVARHADLKPGTPIDQWLLEKNHLAVKQHLTNLATIMGPIMIGPIGNLLGSSFG